ncbi:MAG: type II toxin-antitoxin system RelE/ParE family toxin [Planctomycetes bacterium]|nr:type II toxin-antitoxin system RelE/ParE family toxin [Planctomycetota bacterium]
MSEPDNWNVDVTQSAEKYVARLDRTQRERFEGILAQLADDPYKLDIKPLKGRAGWRLRFGSYRALFELDIATKSIIVTAVGPRGDVYK